MEEGKSAEDIGHILSVRAATVRRWSQKYSWRAKRVLHRRSALSRIDKLYGILDGKLDELEGVEAGEVNLGMLQELTTLIKAVNQMRRQYFPGEILVYASEFLVPWLKLNCGDEELRKQIFHYLNRATDEALKVQDR